MYLYYLVDVILNTFTFSNNKSFLNTFTYSNNKSFKSRCARKENLLKHKVFLLIILQVSVYIKINNVSSKTRRANAPD